MISAKISSPFLEAVSQLGTLKEHIVVPKNVQNSAQEIRIRIGKQIVIESSDGRYIINHIVTKKDIDDCISAICHFSVHCYEKEFKNGFITLKGGHRVGFCGTAIEQNDKLTNIKNISSMNVRIAREMIGCAEGLRETILSDDFRGILLAGKPMSAKTTMLRDICRIAGEKHKVSIIDTRSEIAALDSDCSQLSVGVNSDILNGYSKSIGINIAIRVLSPEYIACDEITGETEAILNCIKSGAKLIFTMHSFSLDEVLSSEIVKSGAFSHITFLENGSKIGRIKELVTLQRENEVML